MRWFMWLAVVVVFLLGLSLDLGKPVSVVLMVLGVVGIVIGFTLQLFRQKK